MVAVPEALLNEAILYIIENIREMGGCDHSTGICMCADSVLADKLAKCQQEHFYLLPSNQQKVLEIVNYGIMLTQKFIQKVQWGRAQSVETYADCQEFMRMVKALNKEGKENSNHG